MVKKNMSVKDLFDFTSNDLSKDKMQEISKSIKDDGKSPMLFHQMMFSYYCNSTYYESLIGADEYFLKKKSINLDRKEDNPYLTDKRSNKIINHLNNKVMKNFERMGLNLPENMSAVRTAIDGLQPIIEKIKNEFNGDARAFAYSYFAKEMEFEREEVDEIVDDLLKGIRKFDSAFDNYKSEGFMATSNILNEALENQPLEKRQDYLANMLTALQGMQKEKVTQEELDVLLDENRQKDLEELKVEVSAKLEDCIGSITSSFFNGLEILTPEELNEIKVKANVNTEEHKLNVALALYIAQLKGDVDYFTKDGMSAELTGMTAAAGVAADYATNQFVNGEVEFEPWQITMKFILGALFMVIMGILGTILVAGASVGIVGLLMIMFGQGIIASIIALVIACLLGKAMIEKIFEYIDWFLQKIEIPYDNFVLKVTAWVKAKMASLKKEKEEEQILPEVPAEQPESELAMETTEQEDQPEEEKKNNENYSEDIETLLSE